MVQTDDRQTDATRKGGANSIIRKEATLRNLNGMKRRRLWFPVTL